MKLFSPSCLRLRAVAVKVGGSCSQKRHFESVFWDLWVAGTHSWVLPCADLTDLESLAWRGTRHTFVRACLLCCDLARALFQRPQINSSTNKNLDEAQWRSSKAFGSGVSGGRPQTWAHWWHCNYRYALKSAIVGRGDNEAPLQSVSLVTLMSNTCFPPQPNRNRRAYLEPRFACRLQGLMFAIWEPQRVFTWSVIQKVVGERIHPVPLCFAVAMHLCENITWCKAAGIKTAESMSDTVQRLSSVQSSERWENTNIFSGGLEKAKVALVDSQSELGVSPRVRQRLLHLLASR